MRQKSSLARNRSLIRSGRLTSRQKEPLIKPGATAAEGCVAQIRYDMYLILQVKVTIALWRL